MAKKRRTKQQKIIARLRRQLDKQKTVVMKEKEETQKVQLKKPQKTKAKKQTQTAAYDNELFFYNSALIKKDLLRTLIFSLVIFTIIGFFYWGIELNGARLIRQFLRL